MAIPSTYKAIHLARRPTDFITADTFTTKKHGAPSTSSLKHGQVLLQTNYLSLDPAMRGWLNDARSYLPPVKIDAIMRGSGVCTVLATQSSKFSVGEIVYTETGWTEMAVVEESQVEKLDLPSNGRPTDSLGALGMPALTAYFGLLDVGQVKAGDFVVVSAAAGATGSVVGQIAKLKGAKVLGLAGSDEKCRWLTDELGFDVALNYKSDHFPKQFRAETKQLIDLYFDNVGGDILDMALARAKPHARFVMCGGISQYNTKDARGPKNYLMIVSMRIRMQGFIVFDYEKQYAHAKNELAQWMKQGKIKRQETIIKGGIEQAPAALQALYEGKNVGKMIVEVKPIGQTCKL